MNRVENLMVTVMEECAEISEAVSKALRFGLDNFHPDTPDKSNEYNILKEYYQLQAMIEYLQSKCELKIPTDDKINEIKYDKMVNVLKYQDYSRLIGTIK